MLEIIEKDEPTHREVWKRDKAVEHFRQVGKRRRRRWHRKPRRRRWHRSSQGCIGLGLHNIIASRAGLSGVLNKYKNQAKLIFK